MKLLRHFFGGFNEGMKKFGNNISVIINSVLLSIVYLIGVGIVSIFAKLFGKHFLDTKISENSKSYWSNLNLKKQPLENYYRQF